MSSNFYVPLTDEEFVALSRLAMEECRHPKEQARHIIRQALFGDGIDNLRLRVEQIEKIVNATTPPPTPPRP